MARGYRPASLGADLLAGVTLAASGLVDLSVERVPSTGVGA